MLETAQRDAATTEAPAPSDNLGWLLAQTSHVLSTEMTAAMAGLGLSPRGHCLLSSAATGEHTQKEIADAIGLDKTTMVVTLDDLERQGLAERRPSPSDRRARIVVVTPAGEELIAKGKKVIAGLQEEILGGLPQEQREGLMDALNALVRDRLSTPAACKHAPRRRS